MEAGASTEKYRRPGWDEYFMEIARVVARRATCDRGRSGCVIVKGRHPLTVGYVGSPPGAGHCDDIGHLMKKVTHDDGTESMHCMRTVHAEQNAILQAAKLGISLDGTTLYCKMTPCRTCAMLIMGSGIVKVIAEKRYHKGEETERMFREAGLALVFFDESVEKYPGQK